MREQPFDGIRAAIGAAAASVPVGRVIAVGGGVIRASGLVRDAGLGDRVSVLAGGTSVAAEVVGITAEALVLVPEGSADGIAIGDAVELAGRQDIAPHDGWIGRVVDPFGRPLDGGPLLPGSSARPLLAAPPAAAGRRPLGPRIDTGLCVFDTFLPLARGQRIGLFAGSGVGKSSLLADLARGVSCDIAVVALVGERGREVRAFVEEVMGPEGMARTVVVAATSDQPALTRRRCAHAAMAVAEHFRDAGRHVLFLADSITRFAEAHREVALAAGEAAALRGYPPSVAQQIMGLAERAGPGSGEAGDITAVLSVLVAGSDMEGAVADILRGVLDGHVVLDRAIAERGRFPAVDLLRSVSRSLPAAASAEENRLLLHGRRLLGAYERAELVIQAGLYAKGADPLVDAAVAVWPALDAFIGAKAAGAEAAFAQLGQLLAAAEA